MNDKKIILDKITELFISKSKPLDKTILAGWTNILAGIADPPEIIKAINQEIISGGDFPTVAQICDRIRDKAGYEIEALDAWEEMIDGVRHHRTDHLSDLIKRVVYRCGGFDGIGRAHVNYEIPEIKKTFLRIYIYEKNNQWQSIFLKELEKRKQKQIDQKGVINEQD